MKTKKEFRWFEELSLPVRVRADLEAAAETQERAEAKRARRRERRAQARYEAAVKAKNAAARAASVAAPAVDHGEALFIAPRWTASPRVALFDETALREAYQKIKTVSHADKDRTKNRIALIERIASRGSSRDKGMDDHWRATLASLRTLFANFAEVLDVVEAELTLADGGANVSLPPLLLNGSPGCGKTFFAQRLADLFNTGFVRISMETAQTAAELTGTAEHWGNTQPGRLFDQLIDGDHINPVVLLDEVDKAGGGECHRSDKALYALLERESARQWWDLSFPGLKLDASHVIWVLTSNDAGLIPAPLRSRMRQFDIPKLDAHAARQLVRSLYQQEVARHPRHDLAPDLSIAHCDVLRTYSPREMVRLCHALVARITLEGRHEVTSDDLAKIGALSGRLVEFDRLVTDFERYAGRKLEWKRQ